MSSCNDDSSCSSCSSESSCGTDDKQKHTDTLIKKRLGSVKNKIMVMSGKGGVGKSTVSVNLAATLNMLGYKVGILDADIHGPNIPKMFGVSTKGLMSTPDGIEPPEPIKGLKIMSVGFLTKSDDDAIIWRAPLKHSVIQQFLSDVLWGDLDFLLIDLPPGTGDEPLSVAHLIGKIDGAVIVTTPQEVALLDSRKSVTFSQKLNTPVLGIVENMSGLKCPHCNEIINLFKTDGGKNAAKDMNVNFLGKIPIDPAVVEDGDNGTPYVTQHPDSVVTNAFKEIAEQVIERTLIQ